MKSTTSVVRRRYVLGDQQGTSINDHFEDSRGPAASLQRYVRSQVKLADGTGRKLTQALRAPVIIMPDVLDDLLLGMDFLRYPTSVLSR